MKRALVVLVCFVLSCSTTQSPQIVIKPGPVGSIMGMVVTTDGFPLPGVTVTLRSRDYPSRTEVTDANGRYTFLGLTHGAYTLVTELQGFGVQSYTVNVTAKEGVALETALHTASVSESITVTAGAPSNWLPDMAPRGRRASSPSVEVPSAPSGTVYTAYQEVQPAEPEQVAVAAEHGFIDTKNERIATFAIDVDRASYANVRRYLRGGLVPPPQVVRIEEMLNYFTYSYPQPKDDVPFSITRVSRRRAAGAPYIPRIHSIVRANPLDHSGGSYPSARSRKRSARQCAGLPLSFSPVNRGSWSMRTSRYTSAASLRMGISAPEARLIASPRHAARSAIQATARPASPA